MPCCPTASTPAVGGVEQRHLRRPILPLAGAVVAADRELCTVDARIVRSGHGADPITGFETSSCHLPDQLAENRPITVPTELPRMRHLAVPALLRPSDAPPLSRRSRCRSACTATAPSSRATRCPMPAARSYRVMPSRPASVRPMWVRQPAPLCSRPVSCHRPQEDTCRAQLSESPVDRTAPALSAHLEFRVRVIPWMVFQNLFGGRTSSTSGLSTRRE